MGRFPSCSICIESFRDFADIAACACGHTFHRDCIVEWRDRCQSRGQSPICPTCQEPVENKPASGLIPKFFFSFDVHTGPINFDDEFLAKEIDKNEKLESDATMHKAEITQLRLQLKEFEAQQKIQEENHAAQLKIQEANKIAQANHFRKIIDDKDAALKHVDELLNAEKSVVKRTEDLLTICQQENSALKRNVDALNKLVEETKAAQKVQGAEGGGAKCNVCEEVKFQIFIWNVDFDAKESHLRKRFHKWSPKEVVIHYDNNDYSLGTAHVVFWSPEDAQEARANCDGTYLFGRELKMRCATGEEIELQKMVADSNTSPWLSQFAALASLLTSTSGGRHLFVSNIQYSATDSELKDFFSEGGDVKQFHLLRDAEGYSLGKADVVFKDREGANNALEYDGFWLFGRPLRIELAHTSCEPCARAMCQ